jgi:serine O-acetyltransferase
MSEYLNAIKLYKISNKLYNKKMMLLASVFQKFNDVLHNSHIPCSCKIGYSSTFAYGGIGVVIHDDAVIGEGCMIGQNITIGGRTGHGGPR